MTAARGYRTAFAMVLGWALAGWLLGGWAFGADALAGEVRKIRIGTEGTFKPFTYVTPDGKLTGFDVELTLAACKAAGLDCEMVTMDYAGIVTALLEKRIDAISTGMPISVRRKKVVDFTDRIRASTRRFVSCTPGIGPDISPTGLKGRILGSQADSGAADYLNANYKGADIRLYKSMDEAYQDLGAGRVDLVLSEDGAGYGFISSPSGKGCDFVGPRLRDKTYFGEGIGIAIRKGDDSLRTALNEGIRKVLADGTYKALNTKYFPFPVY